MPKLKILSFGAGAIGTYVGGSFALSGNHLVYVEQPAVVAELRNRGMRLNLTLDKRRNDLHDEVLPPSSFIVVPSLEEALRSGPFDIALFALKSFDTMQALKTMEPLADMLPPLLCLSNGVENEPMIARVLGTDKVIAAAVTSAIGRRGPGDVVLERLRGIGLASSHPLSEKLMLAAKSVFLNPRGYSNAVAMKWSKMLTNLIANPSSAILDMTAAEVFGNPKLYRLEIEILRECLAVMKAQHIPVVDLPGVPTRALAVAVNLPVGLSKPLLARAAGTGRGGKMPSFHNDLHSGRGKSEVEYLNGAVVRTGQKYGVPTPVNQVLTETLVEMTRGDIPLDEFSHQPEKLLGKIGM